MQLSELKTRLVALLAPGSDRWALSQPPVITPLEFPPTFGEIISAHGQYAARCKGWRKIIWAALGLETLMVALLICGVFIPPSSFVSVPAVVIVAANLLIHDTLWFNLRLTVLGEVSQPHFVAARQLGDIMAWDGLDCEDAERQLLRSLAESFRCYAGALIRLAYRQSGPFGLPRRGSSRVSHINAAVTDDPGIRQCREGLDFLLNAAGGQRLLTRLTAAMKATAEKTS